ncbi:MAG TPA: hypothetical protein VF525_16430 [Pyrinomonadaceae bacterium]|jgi:hypothetical protein
MRNTTAAARTVQTRPHAARRKDLLTALLIFASTALIFLASHVHQMADSRYSILLSQSLLRQHSFTLDSYRWPPQTPRPQVGYNSYGDFYQLETVGAHIYYFFPPGSSLLSLPYVALLNACGVSAANADGTYNQRGEVLIQVSLAALLMAGLAAIFFCTSRLLLSWRWSVAVALGGALGTQVWSTASRALWSDTWGIFLLGLVVWQLLADERRAARLRPMLLATTLAWLYFVRPTYAIPILAVTIYLCLYRRALLLPYALAGAAWAALLAGYSLYHFGQPLPHYYSARRLHFGAFPVAFAGNLVSPARGLLVYVPALIFVGYLLLRYARTLPCQRLAVMAGCVVAAHLVIVAGFDPWWGGHSYGPRYTTGLVPWFVLLAMIGLKGMQNRQAQLRAAGAQVDGRALIVCGAVLLALSVLINARGALAHATWRWNVQPVNVDEHPERVWDWRDPQFLARERPDKDEAGRLRGEQR